MSACADSSVETEDGVSVRMGIFDPLVLRGVPLSGLETLVDFVSGLGLDSLAGNGFDLSITTVGFTVTSVFICFVNP